MELIMGNKGYRYVPKKLSDISMDKVDQVKSLVQQMISSCTTFEDRKKAIYKGVDVLFRYIATTEEYEKSQREPKKFEAEEFDIDSFGDTDTFSPEHIDWILGELGFGATQQKCIEIEQEFLKSNASGMINFADLEKLAKRTLATFLSKDQLEFMKKTQFLSEFFKNQQKSENCEANIQALATTTEIAKGQVEANDTIETKGEVMIGDTKVSTIASQYIEELVMASYKKAQEDGRYAPIAKSRNQKMGIVCGLPGLGKSSIFINDLKRQGYLCVDLDDIAISISKRFGVPINKATSDNIYSLANMVHDTVVAQSMEKGYNIAIEKIGYDKKQITDITENMESIERQVGAKLGRKSTYKKSLLMAAGSSISSAESNSIRNAEQIFSGSDLRAYHYSELI